MTTEACSNDAPSVLLIGNYAPDCQRSMQRYLELLETGLKDSGIRVESCFPLVVFGRLMQTQHGLGKWLGYIDKYLFAFLQIWIRLRRKTCYDVVHICDHSNAHYVFALGKQRHTVTCHDMLAVRSALGEFTENPVRLTGRLQQKLILRGLKSAQQINCVSNSTAGDVRRLTGRGKEMTPTIPNALPTSFFGDADQAIPELSTLPIAQPYLLHLGSDAWYKNRRAILGLFKEISKSDPKVSLVIIGPTFSGESIRSAGIGALENRIHYLSGLSDAALRGLYQNAELLLFPSIIEGFGWPILEAQACGTPVLTCATSPMSELNASDSLIIDGDPTTREWHQSAAAACTRHLLSSHLEKAELSESCIAFSRHFALDSVIQQHIDNYRDLLGHNAPARK